ncbi:alpha-hydroxy acid oxidase [Noviherbaspirillum humi]|nr:alpha-hydroxy acid oxidase [Noviherbaspirillum humi]
MQRQAHRCLPKFVADYVEGGAEDEQCLQRNRADLQALCLLPQQLQDTSSIDTAIRVFGQSWRAPFGIAPLGLSGLVRAGGDIDMARAAASAGVPFILSSASNCRIEAVRDAAPEGMQWLQLYVMSDRAIAEQMVRRARQARYAALVLTVDVPVSGYRQRDMRNGLRLPFRPTPRMMLDMMKRPAWLWRMAHAGMPRFVNLVESETGQASPQAQAALLAREMDRRLAWEDIAWLRRLWNGPLLVEGLLHPADVQRAQRAGVDGVIVSNHGGRQLDAAPSTIRMLPAALDAAAGRLPVFIDGGFRRGSDIAKALALGAAGVFIGRPALYGLAANGEEGVSTVLRLLEEELARTMTLLGTSGIGNLGPQYLHLSEHTLPATDLQREFQKPPGIVSGTQPLARAGVG